MCDNEHELDQSEWSKDFLINERDDIEDYLGFENHQMYFIDSLIETSDNIPFLLKDR